jgi:hypothetical protein
VPSAPSRHRADLSPTFFHNPKLLEFHTAWQALCRECGGDRGAGGPCQGGGDQRQVYGFAMVDDRGGRHYEPVIRPETTGSEIATWGEIVESRLLAEYRNAGVPIINLRPVVNRLRRMLETPYPLASARLWLTPEGKDIVAEAQAGLPGGLWLVRTGEDLLPLDWTPPAKRFQSQVHWESKRALAPS